MKFLLFLILWALPQFEFVAAQCGAGKYHLPGVGCNNARECVTNSKYDINESRLECDEGKCCLHANYCIPEGITQSLVPLAIAGNQKATLCPSSDDCVNWAEEKSINKPTQCYSSICCEKPPSGTEILTAEAVCRIRRISPLKMKRCKYGEIQLIEEKECQLDGKDPIKSGCTIDTGTCGNTAFCGKDAVCCERRLCEGTGMLPMHDVNNSKEMVFLDCTNTKGCTSLERRFPYSYCSKVVGATNAQPSFCCPAPHSEVLRSIGGVLYPTKVFNLFNKPEVLVAMGQTGGEFGAKCEKNSDCPEGQFCDKVVMRNSSLEENIRNLESYEPKMCFPKPRCAGVALSNPDGLGVELCESSSSVCSNEDAFCDVNSNYKVPGSFENIAVCCLYDCTKEAEAYEDNVDKTLRSYARPTANRGECSLDTDCNFEGRGAKCVIAKDNTSTLVEGLAPAKEMRLCCLYHRRADVEQYKCHVDTALKDSHNKVIRCDEDKTCNVLEGTGETDESIWDYECVTGRYCCKRQTCKSYPRIYMKNENDCKEGKDCLKEEEDKTSKVDSRAICADYYVGTEKKNKKCCPLDDPTKGLPYCTKRQCTALSDCMEAQYCHPTKKTCCVLGATKLDGTFHENTTACRSTCEDRVIFGVSVAQYCVRVSSDAEAGMCYLNPYVLVKERERKVNPVYKTILIVSIILCLVFAFLAMIMFVNYRSKNFCDKYTPKKKKGKGKGKKGKKDKDESGTKSSEVSGTTGGGTSGGGTTGGGTTGGGTTGGTKDATGTSGTGATDNVSGTGA